MDKIIESGVTVALAVVSVAMLAVLVSGRAQTANVISASGGAFSRSLETAELPVLGTAEAPEFGAYY